MRSAIADILQPPDDERLLEVSPIVRGLRYTAEYMRKHGGVGLTNSGAFNRKFLHWAADQFDWPEYTAAELFRFHKVLDEPDFPPAVDIHALFVGLQLGRRRKNEFMLTRAGEELIASPGRVFAEVVPAYLFRMDHAANLRSGIRLLGSWDIFLSVINVEAHHSTTLRDLRVALYGPSRLSDVAYDPARSTLYFTVVRPLAWAGLLQTERMDANGRDYVIVKSELWRRYLRLESDVHLRPRIVQ